MGKNRMLERLRANDKHGLFNPAQVSVNYSTGFLPFDYANGYTVKVMNEKDEIVDSYHAVGVSGGTFITLIGKSGTAKTTLAIQMSSNIVSKFDDDSFVMIFDLEQALNYTRIKNITGMSNVDLDNKMILRQEKNYIEDIFDTIIAIAKDKEANKSESMYDTGLLDEFGKPIKAYKPHVIIVDSIPTLASKNTEGEEKIESETSVTRMAKIIKQFYSRLMPIIKTYNITVIAINHINAKVDINPFAKTQAQVMYLKQDESLPGGMAPIYYANTLIKLVSSTKYKEEDDGFDGFLIKAELLKSRTNKAGRIPTNLVYNQSIGFDPILSLYQLAVDNNLVDGRNPYKYFKANKDIKFNAKNFRYEFDNKEEVRNILREVTEPLLEKLLG